MLRLTLFTLILSLLVGCNTQQGEAPQETVDTLPTLTYETPAALDIPAPMNVSSVDDWEAKVFNKDIEIIQVLNVINPIAAYITAGFEKYGTRFSPTLTEEWEDTVVQLTAALTLYEDCNVRRAAGSFDKQLFLDMEEVWQLLVKTGVAGVRTNQMVDSEMRRIAGA
ncbi:MAG TPA: hypothetical protein ENH10_10810 [Bacteroidetes bacterium]|nr:hypothetical protein BMS3Bbin04_01609 [bacterium BMS3Bbin04]HDO66498.1 hypothetical protein [Bacteroidota bacterium]HEX05623.1 hypothetical protein [Bacteroidota bacterium]